MGLAWVPSLRFQSGPDPVPRCTLSVTRTAIAFARGVQWIAVVVFVVALVFAVRWWYDAVLLDETATHLDSVVQRLKSTASQIR